MTKYNVYQQFKYWLILSIIITSCQPQNKPENPKGSTIEQTSVSKDATNFIKFGPTTTTEIGKNILCILQDKNDNYWFGTQNSGVYRYDGKTVVQYTKQNGLSDNQVQSIQEDKLGNIWFGTGGFGVSRFDGRIFTTLTNVEGIQPSDSLDKKWKIEPDDLWFNAGGGVYRYDGHSFTYLPLPQIGSDSKYSQSLSNRLTAYGVYCTLKVKKGTFGLAHKTWVSVAMMENH